MNDSLQIMLHGVGYSELVFTDGSILPINKSQNINIKVDATTAEIEGGDGFYALLQYITKKTGAVEIDNATMSLADLKAVTGDDVTTSAERLVSGDTKKVAAGAVQLTKTANIIVDSVNVVTAAGLPLTRLTSAPTTAVAGARTYTVGTNAVANDTMTIDGVTFTATSSTTNATSFAVGASIADTITNIQTAIEANSMLSAKYTVTKTTTTFTLTETVAGGGNTPATATYTGTLVITSGTATTSVSGLGAAQFYVTSEGAVQLHSSLNGTDVTASYYYTDSTGLAIHSLEDSVPGNCEVRHRIITDEMEDGKRYELNIRVYKAKAKGSYDYTAKKGAAFAPKLSFTILDAGRTDKRTLSYSISEYTA